jgi:hypothetical protein
MKATSVVYTERDVGLKAKTLEDLEQVYRMLGGGKLASIDLTDSEGHVRHLTVSE